MNTVYTDQVEQMWHDTVTKSERMCRVTLPGPARMHLEKTLEQYTTRTDVLEHFYALRLDDAVNQRGIWQRRQKLADVGNLCLIICGLLPGFANRRNMSPTYYAELGEISFFHLSEEKNESIAWLLAKNFENMTHVMRGFHLTGNTEATEKVIILRGTLH